MSAQSRTRAARHALGAAVLALTVAAGGATLAQQPPAPPAAPATAVAPTTVVARVNGIEIRQSDLDLAEEDLANSLPPMSPEQKREYLVTYVIDMLLVATAANEQKIGDSEAFKARLAFLRNKALMESLLDQTAKAALTPEAMKKLYDEAIKSMAGQQEVRARHILVETEAEAKEILAKLRAGGDFAALAKEHSKDPGSADGGDLGFFTKDQMVPEFADMAFKLKPGDISEPVKTQFGWHIIKVEEKRDRPVPPFERVKDQIEQYLVRQAQAGLITKLREGAKIERIGEPKKN
jgi:peptidyl-prolyl cis-trans isomerase C